MTWREMKMDVGAFALLTVRAIVLALSACAEADISDTKGLFLTQLPSGKALPC